MNFVVTGEMLDLMVLVGAIFGIAGAGYIAYGEVLRYRGRKSRTKEGNTRGRKKPGKAGKSR